MKKVTMIMYRTFGIYKGRGYQPVYIYEALKNSNYLDEMIVWRVRDRKKREKLLSTPFFILIIAYGLLKLNSYFKIKKIGAYLFLLPFFDLFLRFKLKNYKNKTIIFNYYPSQYLLKFLKSKNNKIIFYVGQIHPNEWEGILKKELNSLPIKIDSPTLKDINRQKPLLKYANSIITMSNYSKETWQKENKDICVAPLGVDHNFFKPSKKDNNKTTFLYVGRGTYEKGIQYLIKAWKELNLKNAELYIVGGINNNEKEYFDLLLKDSKNITLFKYMQVDEIFAKSHILVHPTLAGGFEKVVLEAMASGLAIITTKPASHFVKEEVNGFIVKRRDYKELAKKMLLLYENKELLKQFSKNSILLAKDATWDNFAKSFVKCIEKNLN